MHWLPFGYVGPETLVPAASALAAIIGGLLAFGRTGFALCSRVLRFLFGRQRDGDATAEEADGQEQDNMATPSRRAA